MTAEELVAHLGTCSPRAGPERIFAEDISKHLTAHQIDHSVEWTTTNGRPDIRVQDIAIELKVQGSAKAVAKQLSRYLLDPSVNTVILVTTSRKLAATLTPISHLGKPLLIVYIPRI